MRLTALGANRRPQVAVLLAIAATLVVAGVALLVMAVTRTSSPPQQPPVAAAAPVTTTSTPPPTVAPTGAAQRAQSNPVRVDIPSIGVSSSLLSLGLNPDGTTEVPPIERNSRAGWYRYSPTPGQLGPAVIAGHVDSAEYGPGIFSRLAAMRPGELVSVSRADNTVAVFRVQQVATYAKASFPTQTVYGNTDHPALRLITCGGSFDTATRSYRDNTVVYADFVNSHPVGSQ